MNLIKQLFDQALSSLTTAEIQNTKPPIPSEVVDTYFFFTDYADEFDLSLHKLFKELALLDILLKKCEKDENFFWDHRFQVFLPLKYLLQSNSSRLIESPFLIECNDVTIRVIHLLNKYRHWIYDTEKINEDENFLKMQAEILTRFTYILTINNEDDVDDWDIDDLPCRRCCFCILHYTIEDLIKKAKEMED